MSETATQIANGATTPMIKKSYMVRFLTPAFLGNAGQNGQWRTPPFKALLRQWWRVAWVAEHGYDVARLREAEGKRFGTAVDNTGRKSRVRIRLGSWSKGSLQSLPATPKLSAGKFRVASALYLGYGPVKTATDLKKEQAIGPDEENQLEIAFPGDGQLSDLIGKTLFLIHLFGALGGRSRNGWGSLALEGISDYDTSEDFLEPFMRDWKEAMKLDWAHAIGRDDAGPLIWQTEECSKWESVIGALANVRKKVNEKGGQNRKVLNQPVKGKGGRLPNSLRFKVRKDNNEKLYGLIFHMPCKPTSEFNLNDQVLQEVWSQVHRDLDENTALERIPVSTKYRKEK